MIEPTDKVLLKIYRRFNKNESIQVLFKKISDLELENGMLKSEIEESKHQYKVLQSQKPIPLLNKSRKDCTPDEKYEQLLHNNKALNENYSKINKQLKQLKQDYATAMIKLNKLLQ